MTHNDGAARPEWGTRRWVQFRPIRRDDLKPAALLWVDGDPFEVEFVGMMDEGPYEGQPMWQAADRQIMPGVAWLPDCDFIDAPRD